MWTEMSNQAILLEIGKRIREIRIRKNIQQKELSERSGVSLSTVIRLENGSTIALDNLLCILRTLDMLENIEYFLPHPPVSPILMRKLQGRKKQRVRKTKEVEDE